ncbi:MAG: glycoside hydrolase family 127 protein [Candidatus Bipolaricaulia bacterium]
MSVLHFALATIFVFLAGCGPESEQGKVSDYPIQPVAGDQVHFTDSFWAERVETNREVTFPHVLTELRETGRIKNLQRAAANEGEYTTSYPFDETDIYKAIEGASHILREEYDPALDQRVDSLIAIIESAQEEDGYLYPYGELEVEDQEQKQWWRGTERWEKVALHSHEFYNAGHLIEAAVVHYRATGKRSLLDVAIKFADLIEQTFGPEPDQRKSIPGHPELEKALVKLYRVTGERKYLDLADFFLAERGKPKYNEEGENGTYKQNHKPIKEQSEAVGHAVRATYLYSAVTDVGVLTDDTGYLEASQRLWENVVNKKFYLIGGLGAEGAVEGFGPNYELPNAEAYNETDAAIGNVMWNYRLFREHGHAKYIDVLERSLYNNVLAGISLEGDGFFYPNPLRSDGDYQRSGWFTVACCVSGVVRFVPTVSRYVYATRKDTAYVNLYAGSVSEVDLASTSVEIEQQTDYPWSGHVRLRVRPEQSTRFTLKLRVPGWARGEPVPSDLYRYVDASSARPQVSVNGEPQSLDLEKGYVTIERTWSEGDIVELDLPMEVRTVAAHDSVEADRGKVALERGPIVYAAESVDNEGSVRNYALSPSADLKAKYRHNMLEGVTVLKGTAYEGKQERSLTAIPYYAWAHRGDSRMTVWMDRR